MKKLIALLAASAALSANAMADETHNLIVVLTATNQTGAKIAEGRMTLNGTNLVFNVLFVTSEQWVGAIHGPGSLVTNAPLILDLGEPFCEAPHLPFFGGGCEFRGEVGLSAEQANQLLNGLWYFKLNARLNLSEEYRGQILLDDDGDGVPDNQDQCLGTSPGAVVNARGCSLEQLCPCSGQWKNHAEYSKCARNAAGSFVNVGLMTPAEARTVIRQAVQSDCGKPGR